MGSVRDIADATVYLFADTGSYVNGQTLVGEFSGFDNYKIPQANPFLQLTAHPGVCPLAPRQAGLWPTPISFFRVSQSRM